MVQLHSSLNWEIIVVDDNSPDGTQEVALELQRVYGEDRIASITNSLRLVPRI